MPNNEYLCYAGVGSRDTPVDVCDLMELAGEYLADKGLTLRSGGAEGADEAFERGCDKVKGKKEIYLPWKGFNKHPSLLYHISQEAYVLASKYHPGWAKMEEAKKQGAMAMHARNGYQVLGPRLLTPVRGVICWTKGGRGEGGTGQAIRIATAMSIPLLDLGLFRDFETMDEQLLVFIRDCMKIDTIL